MNTIIVLLVLYVLNGEAFTLAVVTPGAAECEVMEAEVAKHLPRMAGGVPQFFAAKCAEVEPVGAAT